MPAQQINLYNAERAWRPPPFGSVHLGWASLAVIGLSVVASLVLNGLTIHERTRLRETETGLQALRRAPGTPAPAGDRVAELERLQALEADRMRVREALQQFQPRAADLRAGHGAELFEALARQAQGALWLTAFSVSADGGQIDLSGRMLRTAALPTYLRSLNEEPLFRGRPFAQLEIQDGSVAGGAAGGGGFVAFTLRSQPAAEEARP